MVSTHSRPKAAGLQIWGIFEAAICFNTQPPEGGWASAHAPRVLPNRFNTQPPEGGWTSQMPSIVEQHDVSTHSRPKAAGEIHKTYAWIIDRFQHTAARRRLVNLSPAIKP